MHVVGTYECKLDPKGRVKLPVSLVKQLKGVETFVLKRSVFQKCLELYTLEEWSAMMEKVNKLNRFRKKNNDFIRRFTPTLCQMNKATDLKWLYLRTILASIR